MGNWMEGMAASVAFRTALVGAVGRQFAEPVDTSLHVFCQLFDI